MGMTMLSASWRRIANAGLTACNTYLHGLAAPADTQQVCTQAAHRGLGQAGTSPDKRHPALDNVFFAGLQVFGDPKHPPDAEFGCCALVYGPDGSEFEGEALLRVDVGAARGGRARSLPLHFVLPADQAIRQVQGV